MAHGKINWIITSSRFIDRNYKLCKGRKRGLTNWVSMRNKMYYLIEVRHVKDNNMNSPYEPTRPLIQCIVRCIILHVKAYV